MTKGIVRAWLIYCLGAASTASIAFSQQAPTVDSSALMGMAEEKLERLSVAPESRHELATIIQTVLSLRVETNFLGYEQDKAFIQGIKPTFDRFSSTLDKSDSRSRSAFASSEFRSAALDALNMNEEQFKIFYSRILTKDPILRSKSPSEIKAAMLLFSALVYSSDPELWRSSSQRSYFWPVCRRRVVE